jgi:lipopolysaccharide/colanic/teichoic acid biosynthesis glycosyltransferase
MSAGPPHSPRWIGLLDLLACVAGFALVLSLYGALLDPEYAFGSDRWTLDLAVSASVAWIAVVFPGGGWRGGTRNWFDLAFCAVGFNLVVQYGLNYLSLLQPTPWPVAAAGGVASVTLIGVLRSLLAARTRANSSSILLVGYDPVAASLAVPLRSRICGVLARDPASVPADLPALGDLSRFEEVVAATRPGCIVFTEAGWPRTISPRRLLELQYSGVVIEDGAALYEDVLQRVCWQRLRPVDLLLADPVTGNRSVKTLQAIYTNIFGLALLLAAVPLLVALTILTAISNRGRALETATCSGLQRIPFALIRFRTRRPDGSMSWMGRLLTGLHLVNLPQLVNVVRGEMGLFGPPPVRQEFADRLCRLLPAYPYRFAVKPGILGWSQANLRGQRVPDDGLTLGYDLYYAKQQSPSFDIDIFLRTVMRTPEVAVRAAGSTG